MLPSDKPARPEGKAGKFIRFPWLLRWQKPYPAERVGPPTHRAGGGFDDRQQDTDRQTRRHSRRAVGVILGVLVAIVAVAFLLNGGEHVGKTTVKGDADLPPVTSSQR